jgi:hypothetical protein
VVEEAAATTTPPPPSPDVTSPHRTLTRPPPRARQRPILMAMGVGVVVGVAGAIVLAVMLAR